MRTCRSAILLALGLTSGVTASDVMAQASTRWNDHGTLKVADNGRHLEHADGTPFFWLGGTAWGMGTRTTREDVDLYLDTRQAQGFTVVQAVAHWEASAAEEWPQASQQRNPINPYGHRPFNGTNGAPGTKNDADTASPAVRPGGGPDNPNDFWDHIDYIVRETRERGMALALLPTWGQRFVAHRDPGGWATPEYNVSEAQAYGQFLGSRYKNEPHIIWTLGGDTAATNTSQGDVRPVYTAMAAGIEAGVRSGDPQADPMITFHPMDPKSSSAWFHDADWLDFNMIQSGQISPQRVVPMIGDDYNRAAGVKPVVNGEPAYEGVTWWANPPKTKTAIDVRRTAYHTFFSGGAGYTYGRECDTIINGDPIDCVWGFGFDTQTGKTWKNLLDSPGAQDLTHLKDFMAAREWWKWTPSQASITSGIGSGATVKVAVSSTDDDELLVYFANNSSATISLAAIAATAEATGRWFNPADGSWQAIDGTFATSGAYGFTPPGGWSDAVLVMQAVPEPAALLLVGAGGLMLIGHRHRRGGTQRAPR